MSSYAYCDHLGCGAPIHQATLNEVAYNCWNCGQGHQNQLRSTALVEAVLALEERLEALEEKAK